VTFEPRVSRAVTETVWVDTLGFKGGHLFCGAGDVPGQNQPHAKSRQAIAPLIVKKRAVTVGIPARIAEVLFQQLDGLRPERADALFTPLSGLCQTLDVRLQDAVTNRLGHAEFLELIYQDEINVRQQRLMERCTGIEPSFQTYDR